jgi:hypothetical protein
MLHRLKDLEKEDINYDGDLWGTVAIMKYKKNACVPNLKCGVE